MTTTTKYLSKQQYRWYKNCLNRAIRSGDPRKVFDTVEETFAEWDNADFAYPDDWHRWEIARRDAEHAVRALEWWTDSVN